MKKLLLAVISFLIVFSSAENVLAQRKRSSAGQKSQTTQQSVRQKQRKNKKEIQKTAKEIEQNRRAVLNNLNALNKVSAEIETLDAQISSEQREIASLDARIKSVGDSITELDNRLSSLSAKYGTAIRKISSRNRNAMSDLAFVFSANSFAEAYRRSRSLKQFSAYRQRKAKEIEGLKAILSERQTDLDALKKKRGEKLVSLNTARTELDSRRERNRDLVAALQKEGKTLQAVMNRKQREAAALEAELDRLIQQEQERLERERLEKERLERERLEKERLEKERIEKERLEKERIAAEKAKEAQQAQNIEKQKPAKVKEKKVKEKKKDKEKKNRQKPAKGKKDKQVRLLDPPENRTPVKPKESSPASKPLAGASSGDFAQLRGNLPSPVKGNYSIVKRFGRQKHPDLKYVETNNPGIDIETAPNAAAVAVADGYVSDIFRLPGYNNIIMVRHGNFLTVYANLGTISVKKGDRVRRGSVLGTVYSDPEDGGRSILHFEIRNEKVKENPEVWLAFSGTISELLA